MRDREILSVMLRVAADAFFLRLRDRSKCSVQPAFRGDPGGDFGVAFQALEIRASRSHPMTAGALRRPAKTAVRLRKWSGRNLRVGNCRRDQERKNYQRCAHTCA